MVRRARFDGMCVRSKLFDDRGLFLIIAPGGGKWWRFKFRFDGKEKSLSLGCYPDVSLKQARERRERAAINALALVHVQILIVEEFQQLLAGSARDQRLLLNLIKSIANDLRISVVGVGTDEARYAIEADKVYISPENDMVKRALAGGCTFLALLSCTLAAVPNMKKR
jgi:hypothetical protein